MPNLADEKIAIVGGGITGLFCAHVLSRQGCKSVFLFEAAKRFGGRIRTIRLDKTNKPLPEDGWQSEDLEFYAEFGPMRIELDKQLLLKALLEHLNIKAKPPGVLRPDRACLVGFPAYASPVMSTDPKYELRAEEVGKTPLQLLRMALLRVIVHLEVDGLSAFAVQKDKLTKQITLAAATQEPVDPIFANWMKGLDEDIYWEIQTRGHVEGVPLYSVGFWNLISDHLSHDAITKVKDLGTFYHLLPENPNAAEWLVWWLLGFAISEQLQGIFGGMECIVDELKKKLDKVHLNNNCLVTALEKKGSKLNLIFDPAHRPPQADDANDYDRVILALPRSAVEKIARKSEDAFTPEREITGLLDSAFGFDMVKMFVVVKNRWWQEDNRANWYATRVPTRELHYWKGLTVDSKQGLIMMYTDKPASTFWANYVPPGEQTDAARSADNPLPDTLRDRLIKKVVQYVNENDVPEITPQDIVWYGIRDWGREPYRGGNHAWRPERRYWVVMRRLADIAEPHTDKPSVHVCGEAYSDYHGFMEGSLRSAVYVLHRILDKKSGGGFDPLPWLIEEGADDPAKSLCVNKGYLATLRKWAANLDDVDRKAPYLYLSP
jgi:monoamine oxidase